MSTSPSMTYDSLVKSVRMYAERSDADFISQIPWFVMMAENKIASQVRGLGMMKVVKGRMKAKEEAFSKPIRWRENISLRITNPLKRILYLRSVEFCRRVQGDDSSLVIPPRFYADYDAEHFLICPAPDQAYDFELAYYERPEPLSESNQTNWTTQNAPQLLLYAALMEAQPFLKNDGRIATFKAGYDEAAQAVSMEAARRATDRSYGIKEA